jgi:hypothetical protein
VGGVHLAGRMQPLEGVLSMGAGDLLRKVRRLHKMAAAPLGLVAAAVVVQVVVLSSVVGKIVLEVGGVGVILVGLQLKSMLGTPQLFHARH